MAQGFDFGFMHVVVPKPLRTFGRHYERRDLKGKENDDCEGISRAAGETGCCRGRAFGRRSHCAQPGDG
ncbi:hypothetical protein MES4922_290123 [Mesorhizobium ventifaucium]|uniref:Uncharacterized protein n=1 Tax=Mesorhizobium ventifaucium TaxID=666020 RepID=A0ABN8JUR9_9HYPH|nr:hypothetical protein MES4922_290123 [Mesorhizobium ventifaucium]